MIFGPHKEVAGSFNPYASISHVGCCWGIQQRSLYSMLSMSSSLVVSSLISEATVNKFFEACYKVS